MSRMNIIECMKRMRIWMALGMACMMLQGSALAQDIAAQEAVVQEEAAYGGLLDMFCTALEEGWTPERIEEEGFWMESFVESAEQDGYMLQDMDGDGVRELIILSKPTLDEENAWRSAQIITIYTLREGSPVKLLDTWSRSSAYLCRDGSIRREGSDGAAYWTCCIEELQGTDWVFREGLQTDVLEEADGDVTIWRRMTQDAQAYDGEILSDEEAEDLLADMLNMQLDEADGFVSFAEYMQGKAAL